MLEFQTKVKEWGNSLGVIIPKDIARNENLKKNEEIIIIGIKKNSAAAESFGIFKNWKTPTQKIKDNLRKELYG